METFDFCFFTLTAEQLMTCLKTLQLAGIFIPVVSVVVILQKEQSKGATYLMHCQCRLFHCQLCLSDDPGNGQFSGVDDGVPHGVCRHLTFLFLLYPLYDGIPAYALFPRRFDRVASV